MTQPLRGVFAPVLTPVHDDLSPDAERYLAFAKYLLDSGCHGLCPFGTTSEANSFSIAERMSLLETLVEGGIVPAVLMPGTGMCAFPDTVQLTKHAVELGCAGVLVLPPFYYKGVPDEGIFRSFAEIIERVADERLRVYLYHIPQVAQVGFTMALIDRIITAYPDTVVGIKDSTGNWYNQRALLRHFPDFAVFSGSEKLVLKSLQHGGAGAINAVANVIPGRLRKLYEGWQGDKASQLQHDVEVIARARGEYAPIPVLKEIAAHQHDYAGWRTLRPPLTALSEEETTTLWSALKADGFTTA